MNVHRAINGWLGAVLLLVLPGVVAIFWTFGHTEDAAQARRISGEQGTRAIRFVSDLNEAESAQRGYLLTGDATYLRPYLEAREALPKILAELSTGLTTKQARQHLDAALPLLQSSLQELGRPIDLRRRNDTKAAMTLVGTGQARKLVDALRFEMAGFMASEGEMRSGFDAAYQRNLRNMYLGIVVESALALLYALYVAYSLARNERRRLSDLLHLETEHRLEVQSASNRQLLQANITLRDSESKLAVTLSSIGDAVIATDATARITLLNRVAQQLTGWTQVQARGRTMEDLFHMVHKQTREKVVNPVEAVLRTGVAQALTNHTVLIRQDGREFDIADSCAPIRDPDDQVVGAVLVFRDVTREQAAQEVLQEKNGELQLAREEADKANQAKSDFLSSMSHELRSPLNAILGFAQLLESGLPVLTMAQKASIDHILRAGWYLLDLINEVLDLSLIESGKLSLSLEPIAMPDILEDCHTLIQPLADKRGIVLHFPLIAGVLLVAGDRTRLKQVLINLLSNAIKYNREGGTVEVFCQEKSDAILRISVQDSGDGLSPEKIARLFQPFNRLGQEGSAGEGTGIGLVVCKRLMQLMGGEIGMSSSVGVGSTFWIELSMTTASQFTSTLALPIAGPAAAVYAGGHLRTLLCVEDNEANMDLVEQLIARRPDMRLLGAADGMRGVLMARMHLPDLILMDINLPGISGLQALKMLQADPHTRHIPVLALSANALPRDVERGLASGFFRYLTKPIKVTEFMEALDMGLLLADGESHVQ